MSNLYQVQIHYNVRIPTRDGLELSANLFMPIAREPAETFPAVLEMIPYRKDGWRYITDHRFMSYLAERGYVGCRLDIRGTGSSEGIAWDEYTVEETQDGYDMVEWLAAQAWCNGRVGMWGISYGGFTSIQVAMLQPPSLKAIVPVYATDDRYTDDVHYIGGCKTASELAQYAVSQVGMNALPPRTEYAGTDWSARWKERLEQTPPWLLTWLRQQNDGPYWRHGSLAPDYARMQCAMFLIGGWHDGYTNPVLRMMEHCPGPRKALIGNWVHQLPDYGYPGPNLDWLHEMSRFFDYWLKGEQNGVMDEPALTWFRREYTEPEPFPTLLNGGWQSERAYPPADAAERLLFLSRTGLTTEQPSTAAFDEYMHRPTLGGRGSLCYGGGAPPNGLSRDLRPDEALSLTYTSAPLTEAVDILGFPKLHLYLSSSAPVAHAVVRLTDVAPDGVSSQVSIGILNLTHRHGHADPQPLTPGQMYEIAITLKATGYRFLPGHCIRVSVASAYWPVIWPAPYAATYQLHHGGATPSRLLLPILPANRLQAQPIVFKTSPPHLLDMGQFSYEPPVWQIIEDVIKQSVTVRLYGGDTAFLPNGVILANSEKLEMTAYHQEPAYARMYNEVIYKLRDHGYQTEIRATGSVHSTVDAFHIDIQLLVHLNGNPFFEKSWLESIPRQLL